MFYALLSNLMRSQGRVVGHACVTCAVCALPACAALDGSNLPNYPRTPAELYSGYNYVPLDPLKVLVVPGPNCKNGTKPASVLAVLPDNAVRIAVRDLSGSGSVGFGPAQVGVQGSSYQVILDYINADVANIRFQSLGGDVTKGEPVSGLARINYYSAPSASAGPKEFIVPVYVGIGLRLTANVTVQKGTVNLASLGALSAAAQAQKITGSLIVQTLGITGKQVTSALPLPSELNTTTIQNAILSLGSVKAMVYDQPDTIVTPRVTGIYNPLPRSDPQTINLIVSQLASKPIPWERDCVAPGATGKTTVR